MDDLQFRRTIYADPYCTDAEVVKAAAEDPAKQAFWSEVKALEKNLQAATKVDVPQGLVEQLMLRQSITSHRHSKRKRNVFLALAASVSFVFGMSFVLWQQQTLSLPIDLGQHALAHVAHEGDGDYALRVNNNIPLADVNQKLREIGAELTDDIGQVFFATYCNFGSMRTLHLVVQGAQGKVTVFVVPHDEQRQFVESFSNDQFVGKGLDMQHASIMMVGKENLSLEQMRETLKEKLVFSA